jgi:hypothetical protein
VLQDQLAKGRERDQKINTLQFLINQAQQPVKTDLDIVKSMAPDDMEVLLWKDVLEGE